MELTYTAVIAGVNGAGKYEGQGATYEDAVRAALDAVDRAKFPTLRSFRVAAVFVRAA